MSIKAIALELYRAQQKVGDLEKELELAAPADENRIKTELRAAVTEMKTIRKMLDGAKAESPFTGGADHRRFR